MLPACVRRIASIPVAPIMTGTGHQKGKATACTGRTFWYSAAADRRPRTGNTGDHRQPLRHPCHDRFPCRYISLGARANSGEQQQGARNEEHAGGDMRR